MRKTILALDTTMKACSVGIHDTENGTLAKQSLPLAQGHAEKLVPMIVSVLAESKKTFEDIDLIGVTKGPGAFTGMRIGLATARSLGQTLSRPVIGICTFNAILETARHGRLLEKRPCAVILETKRTDYYYRLFAEDRTPACEKQALSLNEIIGQLPPGTQIIGDANIRLGNDLVKNSEIKGDDILFTNIESPDPEIIALLTEKLARENPDENPPDPVYLRPPDVSVPKTPSVKQAQVAQLQIRNHQ
jgi:tRNA threonylcarbamoyladenosine biosynthesis protein TsaB